MDIHRFTKVGCNPQRFRTAADIGITGLSRLLHYIAQLTGKRKVALALKRQYFYLQQLTADTGPSQTIDNAYTGFQADIIIKINNRSQIFFQIFFCYLSALTLPLDNFERNLTTDTCQLTLQVTHACFPGIVVNYTADSLFTDADLVFFQSVQLQLLRQKMQLSNLNLFFISIAAQLDNLQTVQQSRRNSIYGICRYNPEYMRQIKREFNKVVTEAVVLLRIKHLQQR